MATSSPPGSCVVAVGRLLPGAHLAPQPRPRIAQRLLRVHTVFAGVGRDARRVDRHPPQLHHALPCAHSSTCVKASFSALAVTAAKRAQGPVVHPLAGSQIAKRKILHQPPLHLPRAGDAQRVSVEPHAQHQLGRIKLPALGAVALLEHAHIQPLNHLADEKAKVLLTQLIPHARRQQISLIRAVNFESRHTSLVAQLRCGLQVPRVVLTQTLKPRIFL